MLRTLVIAIGSVVAVWLAYPYLVSPTAQPHSGPQAVNETASPEVSESPSTPLIVQLPPSTTVSPTRTGPSVPVRLIAPAADGPLIDAPVNRVTRTTGGSCGRDPNDPCPGFVDQLVSPDFPADPCVVDGASSFVGHTAIGVGPATFTNLVNDFPDDKPENDVGLTENQAIWALMADGSLCVGRVIRLPETAPGTQFPGQPTVRYMEKAAFVADPEGDGNEFAKLVAPGQSMSFLQTSTCVDICTPIGGPGWVARGTPGDEDGGRRLVAVVAVLWEQLIPADDVPSMFEDARIKL